MKRLSLSDGDDPKQALRFRRYLMASGTSLMFVLLMGLCVIDGLLAVRPFVMASSIVIVLIALFYVLFRTGINLKARDPSLTLPMMLCAIAMITYALYYVGPARGVFLLMYPVVLFFGVFRSTTGRLLTLTTVILTGYAGVIFLLMHGPAPLERLSIELLQWVVLAAVLLWFSFMGGHVHDLRTRLRESEQDHLTGVYTRRRILEILDHEKTRCDRGAGPLSVCMMDLDMFKRVNDNLGHQAGDLVLQRFARIAQAELRSIDFIGRFGGEEFLLVLTGTELDGAQECAERVRAQTERAPATELGPEAQVTVSIGVAQYEVGETLQETLRRADTALYRAKQAGRNQVHSSHPASELSIADN